MTVKQLRERAKKHGFYMLNILPQKEPTFVLIDNETLSQVLTPALLCVIMHKTQV